MTAKERTDWAAMHYIRRLEANRGHNYQYWSKYHDKLMDGFVNSK